MKLFGIETCLPRTTINETKVRTPVWVAGRAAQVDIA